MVRSQQSSGFRHTPRTEGKEHGDQRFSGDSQGVAPRALTSGSTGPREAQHRGGCLHTRTSIPGASRLGLCALTCSFTGERQQLTERGPDPLSSGPFSLGWTGLKPLLPPAGEADGCHLAQTSKHPQFSTFISCVLMGLGDPHTPSGSGLARSWPVSSRAAAVST